MKQANNNPGFYPIKGQKGPKLILKPVSEYYRDFATLLNVLFDSAFCVSCIACLVESLTVDDLDKVAKGVAMF